MLTGILIVDEDDYVGFLPPPVMVDPVLGHLALVADLIKDSVVIYSQYSYDFLYHPDQGWRQTFEKNATRMYIEPDLAEIKETHKYENIIVIGNMYVYDNYRSMDKILLFKYRCKGIDPKPFKFEPTTSPLSITKLISFDIHTLRGPCFGN